MIIVDFVVGLIRGFNAILDGLQWIFTLIGNIFKGFFSIISFIGNAGNYLFSGDLGHTLVPADANFVTYFMPIIIFTIAYCVFRFIVKIFK